MRIARCHLTSISPYSQSKMIRAERGERETDKEHEKRVWRERSHYNAEGQCYIPPTAFKNMIAEAAKFTPRTGPTGGKSTWTKNFEAGILVVDPLMLGVHVDEMQSEMLNVPSRGRPGPGPRVDKIFPLFEKWSGWVEFLVYDDSITEEIFELYLREAGSFIGVGRFRPRNRGFYGRFKIDKIEWLET